MSQTLVEKAAAQRAISERMWPPETPRSPTLRLQPQGGSASASRGIPSPFGGEDPDTRVET